MFRLFSFRLLYLNPDAEREALTPENENKFTFRVGDHIEQKVP